MYADFIHQFENVFCRHDFSVSDQDMKNITADFNGMLQIPENFTETAEAYRPMNCEARNIDVLLFKISLSNCMMNSFWTTYLYIGAINLQDA